jgi:hypothetical protein
MTDQQATDPEDDRFNQLTREEKEEELARRRAQLAEELQKGLEMFHQFIDEKPDLFAQIVCEAALGIARTDIPNPFIKRDKDDVIVRDSVIQNHYLDLAGALLSKLDPSYSPRTDSEFICLKEWIATQVNRPHPYSGHYTRPELERMTHTFFRKCEEDFGYAILNACILVYHGIPLYVHQAENDTFSPIPFDDDDYIYLSQKGRRSDTHETGMFPDWAVKYYIKREHLDAHEIFFSGSQERAEQVDILRAALRRHIGFDRQPLHPSTEQRQHKTRLLDLIDKVIARYYGTSFDLANRDTWPSQESIVSWLRQEHGLTNREAESVDIVCRSDRIRGKH